MNTAHHRGRRGEAVASRWLARRGWTILARNVRFGHGELDLVIRRGRLVVFVEVKTRASTGYGHPLHAITAAKRREVERAAQAWILRHGQADEHYRFDAIAIVWGRGTEPRVEHVEDAWRR